MGSDSEIELNPVVLLRAYAVGIFPMAESADDDSLAWFDPLVFEKAGAAAATVQAKREQHERYSGRRQEKEKVARGLQRHDHQDGLAGIADLRKEGRGMAREQEGDQ